jgi:hypothetical protein
VSGIRVVYNPDVGRLGRVIVLRVVEAEHDDEADGDHPASDDEQAG